MKITYSVSSAFGAGYILRIDTGGRAAGWELRRTPQAGAYDDAEFERILDPTECELLLTELQQLRLPVMAEGAYGLDGVRFNLEIESGFTRLDLGWWLSVPRQWTDVLPLVKILESLAKRRTPSTAEDANREPGIS